ncbi:MAG: hypothetical protein ACKOFM_06410, partial [Actinomycetota bacterium]
MRRHGEIGDCRIFGFAAAVAHHAGAPARSDRVAKYNQLLRIEQQ